MNQDNQMTETGQMSKEPAFYIELSPQLRHIVMKRAYFLRGLRTRTMFCLEKIAGKAWLEITLIEKANPEILPWDSAHSVAEKFKAELKADVFVEPTSEVGRHHQLTAAPETRDPFSGRPGANEGNNAFGFQDPFAGISGMLGVSPGRSSMPGFSGVSGIPGMPNIAGLPNIPGLPSGSAFGLGGNSNDFLPAHVREALAMGEKQSDTLPALRALPAFQGLPEAKRNMFEVEAMQALRRHSSEFVQVSMLEHSQQSLVALL
ncbi:MAG: hypothetical protein C0508_31055, partial [Cyanobacteria bacterium PR.023]|nr:hypothetical protein [Cyanobacteria bacterium PR.023]